MKKSAMYFGIALVVLGVFYTTLTNQISNLWVSGIGASFITLQMLIDALTLDWQRKFSQIESKFAGTTDAVRGCYAEIETVKGDIRSLNPDGIQELELRVENLEGGNVLRRIAGHGDAEIKTYRPPAPKKKAND